MPASESIADLRRRLEQLNQLEDDRAQARKAGDSTLNSEALIESLRASITPSILGHHDRLRAYGRRSVAEARQGFCSGCQHPLNADMQVRLSRQTIPLKCDGCARFLFAPRPDGLPPSEMTTFQENTPATVRHFNPPSRKENL